MKFSRKGKEFYYLLSPNFTDQQYLEHAVNLLNKGTVEHPLDEKILEAFKARGFFPIVKGDIFSLTDHKTTKDYRFQGAKAILQWELLNVTKGALAEPIRL